MLEVHAILQRQRCNENITKKTGTLSDAYAIWGVIQAKDVFRRGQTDVDNQMVTPDCVDIAIPNKLFRSKKEY